MFLSDSMNRTRDKTIPVSVTDKSYKRTDVMDNIPKGTRPATSTELAAANIKDIIKPRENIYTYDQNCGFALHYFETIYNGKPNLLIDFTPEATGRIAYVKLKLKEKFEMSQRHLIMQIESPRRASLGIATLRNSD